tara:strand:- start:1514 stop:2032 length:519 start_codon:yes stop_codon:yes gene_type:complete
MEFEFFSPGGMIAGSLVKPRTITAIDLNGYVREIIDSYLPHARDESLWVALDIEPLHGKAFMEGEEGLTLHELSKILAMAKYKLSDFLRLHAEYEDDQLPISANERLARTVIAHLSDDEVAEYAHTWKLARMLGLESAMRKGVRQLIDAHLKLHPEKMTMVDQYFSNKKKRR